MEFIHSSTKSEARMSFILLQKDKKDFLKIFVFGLVGGPSAVVIMQAQGSQQAEWRDETWLSRGHY